MTSSIIGGILWFALGFMAGGRGIYIAENFGEEE